MRSEWSTEELRRLRPALVHIKWLYDKAVLECDNRGTFNDLVGVTLLHASIELTIQTILVAHNWGSAKQVRAWSFVGMLDAIDKKGSGDPQPPPLPMRAEIIAIAEMRNDILHHGRKFHRAEVERAIDTARRFLFAAVREFLFEDIQATRLSDSVEPEHMRDLCRAVEIACSAGQFIEAVALAIYTVELAVDGARDALWHGLRSDRESSLQMLLRAVEREQSIPRRLIDLLEGMVRSIESVREREHWDALVAMGLGADSILRFYGLPVVLVGPSRYAPNAIRISHFRRAALTAADAEFAATFAFDVCVRAASLKRSHTEMTVVGDWDTSEVVLPMRRKPNPSSDIDDE
jgi:hypothetical protein